MAKTLTILTRQKNISWMKKKKKKAELFYGVLGMVTAKFLVLIRKKSLSYTNYNHSYNSPSV